MSLMEKEVYEFGPYLLDPTERTLARDGTSVSLTPKAFETLTCLVRNQGHMLTKDDLLKRIWPDTFVEEVNLAVNISVIRKALGDNLRESRYIATVPGHGYRFVAEVRRVPNQNGNGNGSAATAEATTEPKVSYEIGIAQDVADADAISAPRRYWIFGTVIALGLAITAILVSYVLLARRATKLDASSSASIAVLPFTDLSPGRDQAYFSDGLTEELINDLAKVPGMRVVARSSAFQFKGRNEDLREVGRKLGVTNILEGSIRREGDRVRIRAELTKAEDGFQLWSETYDRKIGDIFTVQEQIARAATGALQIKLLGRNGTAAGERSTNSAAYDAYLRAGEFTTRGRDQADLDNALAYVDEAIKIDAKYAPAWALRSYILDTRADVGLMEPATGFRNAREDAERAIELDSNGAEGYFALAWVQINRDWNWEGAELSLQKAAELEPGSASLLRYRSFLCQSLGQLSEAIKFHQQAITLDPLLASSHSYLAYLLYSAGEYEKAEASLQKALELNPQKTYDHFTRGEILLAQGHASQALAAMEQEPAVFWRLTGEALAYDALGRRQDSDVALTELIRDHQQNMAYQIAEIYAERGEANNAFEWLNRAYQQRDSGLRSLKIDPLLKNVQQDHRFAELLKKMRLS